MSFSDRIGKTNAPATSWGDFSSKDLAGQEKATGAGVLGQAGGADIVGGMVGLNSMMQGLAAFASTDTGGDFETRLAEIATKLQMAKADIDTERLTSEQDMKRQFLDENRARAAETNEKMAESHTWNDASRSTTALSSVVGGIAGAVMIAVGAALIAAGPLAPLGVALVAGGVLSVMAAANGAVSAMTTDGAGIAGSIAKAAGADAKEAQGWDMGVGITLMAAALAVSIGTMVVSGGANAAQVMTNAAALASLVADVAAAGTSVAAGVTNLVSSVLKFELAGLQAENLESQAEIMMGDDRMELLMEMLRATNDQFNSLFASITELQRDTNQSLSSTRFAG